MPNEQWGTKRICPTTGKRFYDLNKDPIISPYTGETVTLDANKGRTMVADAEDAQTTKMNEAGVFIYVNNILDEIYSETNLVPMPGRSFLIGYSIGID